MLVTFGLYIGANSATGAIVIPILDGTQGKKDARIAEQLLNNPDDPLNVQSSRSKFKKSAFVYKGKAGHIIVHDPQTHIAHQVSPGYAFIFESPKTTSTLTYYKEHASTQQQFTIQPDTFPTKIYICDDQENITLWQFEGKMDKHKRLIASYAGGKKVKISCCW
jgi:hypothetical protein